MAGVARAVAVVASHDSARRVVEGKEPPPDGGQPGQTVLFAGTATTLGKGALDEELHIQGNSVVWTAGGVLRKQLTAAAPVLKAAWCYFQNTGPDAILCLLHPSALSVYTQDGDSHAIPLPGDFSGLWPLPQGVLLTGAAGQGPCILVHPLENIQEVQMAADIGAAGGGGGMGGAWDEEERMVWSGAEVPYLVTHNTRQRRLAVWSISTQQAHGFVAVTPMRWPGGAPSTPVGTAGAGLLAPGSAATATGGAGQQMTSPTGGRAGGGAGTYKK